MGSLVLTGATSGATTITPSATGTYTITLPAETGTIQTSGAGFTTNGVAYATSTSALTTGTALTFTGTNLGIGTTSPLAKFDVLSTYASDTTSQAKIRDNTGYSLNFTGTASGFKGLQVQDSAGGATYTSLLLNPISGNVGIGTSSPAYGLDVQGTSNTSIRVYSPSYPSLRVHNSSTGTGNSDGLLIEMGGTDALINNYESANLKFATNNTEAMRIDSSQNLQVGGQYAVPPTTSYGRITASGIFQSGRTGTGSQPMMEFFNGNSGVGAIYTSGSSTSYNTSSDYRLKQNIAPMTGALAKVALLKPVTYKWNVDGSDGQGFIAHELQEIVPECVHGSKDGTREEEYEVTPAVKDEEGNITTPAVMGTRTVPVYQGVDTSFLVATLTSAIQELSALVTAQSATITSLTERITALEGK